VQIGPFQILIIALVILVLFGRGRISDMMGDFGKGVKSFRKGLAEDDEPARPAPRIEGPEMRAAVETAAEPKPASDSANS
jgi:sec-independent protein translocase protein TatA